MLSKAPLLGKSHALTANDGGHLISHDYDGQPTVQGIGTGEQGTTSIGLNGGRGQMSTLTQLQRKKKLNGENTLAMLMENPYGKSKSTSTMLRHPPSYQP